MRILIHCNGGRSLGVGHVIRSLALAQEAAAAGHDVGLAGHFDGFFVLDQLSRSGLPVRPLASAAGLPALVAARRPDLVHLDTYDPVPDLPGEVLVSTMEDGAYGRRPADLVVDPNLGAETEPRGDAPEPRFLLRGARYTPLRREVVRRRGEWRLFDPAARVLVVMGGTDPMGLTPRVLELLHRTGRQLQVTAVTRPELRTACLAAAGDLDLDLIEPTDDLPARMVSQDLVVSAAGTSVWELACLGVPMALVCAVENQKAGYERVVAAGAAVGLGSAFEGGPGDHAAKLLDDLLGDAEARQRLARRAASVVDGLGAWRVVRAWEQAAAPPPAPAEHPGLQARPATMADAERLLAWRNDPDTRRNSREAAAIALEQHRTWLERSLAREDRLLLVVADDAGEVGTVRWDEVEPGVWEVSITVAPERRGQRLSAPMLAAGEAALRRRTPELTALVAGVHESNAASRRLFVRAGYLLDHPADSGGFLTYRKRAG